MLLCVVLLLVLIVQRLECRFLCLCQLSSSRSPPSCFAAFRSPDAAIVRSRSRSFSKILIFSEKVSAVSLLRISFLPRMSRSFMLPSQIGDLELLPFGSQSSVAFMWLPCEYCPLTTEAEAKPRPHKLTTGHRPLATVVRRLC